MTARNSPRDWRARVPKHRRALKIGAAMIREAVKTKTPLQGLCKPHGQI